MIYLIQVEYKTTTLLKIGYTKDSSKEARFTAYKMHNPLSEVLFIIPEGTEKHEKALHYLFRKYLYKDYGNEWFNYNTEIIEFFKIHTTKESLDRDLVIFKKEDFIKLFKQIKTIVSRLIFCNLSVNAKELLNECKDKVGSIICTEDDIYSYLIDKYNLTEESQNKLRNIITVPNDTCFSEESKNKVKEFLNNKFYKTSIFEERMRLYCEFMDNNKTNQEVYDLLHLKLSNNKFKDFYDFYGTSGCKALKYREGLLISGMINKMYESKLASVIYNKFEIGKKYTLKEIKIFLQCLYKDNNITILPKATDLEKYFEVKACKISLDGKRDRGFEIIKKK